MASANPQHEPTMEEILASIRKIISEDSSETAAPKQESEVLELTDEVAESPAAAPVPAQPEPRPTPSYVPPPPLPQERPQTRPETDVVFVPREEPSVSKEEPSKPAEHEGIFSDKARQAIDEAFSRIDEPEEEAALVSAPPGSQSEDRSIEAVFERAVRGAVDPTLREWMDTHRGDLLTAVKPLIREWMDEHFPALLEGAIRDEIARVVKARGRR